MGYTLAQFTIAVLEMILYTPGPRKNPGPSEIQLCWGGRPLRNPRWMAQGTGYKAKTIKENLSSPYALRLAPYA